MYVYVRYTKIPRLESSEKRIKISGNIHQWVKYIRDQDIYKIESHGYLEFPHEGDIQSDFCGLTRCKLLGLDCLQGDGILDYNLDQLLYKNQYRRGPYLICTSNHCLRRGHSTKFVHIMQIWRIPRRWSWDIWRGIWGSNWIRRFKFLWYLKLSRRWLHERTVGWE